jgi:hypothetical protein
VTTLVYVHDPMCSWCWGFDPVLRELVSSLPEGVAVRRLLGGLAPDSDEPMPASSVFPVPVSISDSGTGACRAVLLTRRVAP